MYEMIYENPACGVRSVMAVPQNERKMEGRGERQLHSYSKMKLTRYYFIITILRESLIENVSKEQVWKQEGFYIYVIY